MGDVLETLSQWAVQNPPAFYKAAFIGILLNSAIVALISIYLIIKGSLGWIAYVILILGGVSVFQTILYILGRITRKTRLGWKLYYKMKEKKFFQFYSYYLKTNTTKVLLFGKFLPIAPLIVFTAGWYKIPFGRFLKTYIPGLIIWFSTITVFFYIVVSSFSYLQAKEIIKQVEILIILVILVVLFVEYAIKTIIKKEMRLEDVAKKIGEKTRKLASSEEKVRPE